MTDPLQTAGRCSDKQSFFASSLDIDQDGVGIESVVGVQFTSWGDHQLVVAALDVGQPVLARYRHSRLFFPLNMVRTPERLTEHSLVSVVKTILNINIKINPFD